MRKIFTLTAALLCMAGLAQAQPTTVPEPVATGNNAVGIYSSDLGNASGYIFADWGAGAGQEVTIGTKKAFLISNFTYYGSQFDAINATTMTYLHFDIYPMQDMTLAFVPITGAAEKGIQKSLTGNQWNAINIPVKDYTDKGANMANMFQIKYVSKVVAEGAVGAADGFQNGAGNESFYVGNVYLYKEEASYEDTEAPVITDATVSDVSYTSATLNLTATDNKSAQVYYVATDQNGVQYKGTGDNGKATSIAMTGLATGTDYTLSVVATDEKGNASEAKTVKFTTSALPAIPQPTATNYKSIYSPYLGNTDGYFFNSWGGGTGNDVTIEGKTAYQISKFMYFGSEFAATDVTGFDTMHMDVLPMQDMTLAIVPITGTIEKGIQFALTAGKWNVLEVPVATYTKKGANMANLFQIKYVSKVAADGGDGNVDGFANGDGTESFIVGNIYFYTPTATGINDVTATKAAQNGKMFNIAGQQVDKNYKGIVITDGKKMLNR